MVSNKTGDLAQLEGGYLFIHGRPLQDVICFSGWKVFAPEVEEALSTHPSVSQAIILGVSDPLAGQRAAALIIPKMGNTTSNRLDLATIRRWLSQEGGTLEYKLPKVQLVLDPTQKYPVTSSGKPIKPRIREELLNQVELIHSRLEGWDLAVKEPAWLRGRSTGLGSNCKNVDTRSGLYLLIGTASFPHQFTRWVEVLLKSK